MFDLYIKAMLKPEYMNHSWSGRGTQVYDLCSKRGSRQHRLQIWEMEECLSWRVDVKREGKGKSVNTSEAQPEREMVGLRSDGCCRVLTGVFRFFYMLLSDASHTERTPGFGTAAAVTAFQECWTDTNWATWCFNASIRLKSRFRVWCARGRESSGICYYYKQVTKMLGFLIFCFFHILTVLTNKVAKLYFVCFSGPFLS